MKVEDFFFFTKFFYFTNFLFLILELTKETLKSEGDLELLLKSSGLDFDQEEIFRFWKFLRENLGKTVTKVKTIYLNQN